MVKEKGIEKQMYDKARGNLLLMIIFTLVNIILYVAGSYSVILFSATVPYMAIVTGILSETDIFLKMCIVLASVIILLYLFCWLFSKKSPVWLVIALVMFLIDTIALIGIYVYIQDVSGILDLVIHIWVLYYLFIGVKNGYKLKKSGYGTEETDEAADNQSEVINASAENTYPLHMADMDAKYRVLAETDKSGYRVCYRRVKKTNELVINDYVYDAVEMLIEPPHKLTALKDGHLFEAGYDGFHSYIRMDGELLIEKIRIW